MPIIFQHTDDDILFALWQITESEEELRALVTTGDVASCAGLGNPRRRMERLAWRAALREMMPGAGEVEYEPSGAPRIGGGYHLGVSHCTGYAAVGIAPRACAVDIELFSRNYDRTADRFITAAEAALPASADPRFRATVWCAKEALYKFTGQELGLDQYAVTGVEFLPDGTGRLTGHVAGGPPIVLKMVAAGDICLVYC